MTTHTYPLAENHSHEIRAKSGRPLSELDVPSLLDGNISANDIAISPETLRIQAGIARAAHRPQLADNFERGAELVGVPQDVILSCYEILRPGRAKSADAIRAMATRMRQEYGAVRIAAMMDEAATAYERRNLFVARY